MNQKLSDLANLAEIVSAVAVVATLIFLTLEIRTNTETIQASNRQSLAARYEEINLARATNEPLAVALEKMFRGEELSAHEGLMVRGFLVALTKNLEEAFLQYREGKLSENYFLSRAGGVLSYFGNDEAMVALRNWKRTHAYTDEFDMWFEDAIEDRWGPLENIGTSGSGNSTQ